MPGPIKRTPASDDAVTPSSLVRRVSEADADETLPDPTPYQSKRQLKFKVSGETIVVDEVYWTARQLRRWFATCPQSIVRVEADRSYDPSEGGTPSPLAVYYDGFRFDVPTNDTVSVPLPIAQVIRNMQQPLRTGQAQGIDQLLISARNPNGMSLDGPDNDDG